MTNFEKGAAKVREEIRSPDVFFFSDVQDLQLLQKRLEVQGFPNLKGLEPEDVFP